MDNIVKLKECFIELIDKMRQQVVEPNNQSFGSLNSHLDNIIKVYEANGFLDPLYYVELPRWLGEYGNTELEREILGIASEINNLVIEINGGIDKVNILVLL